MRIIVWGINYSPEVTGIGPFNRGLCDYLRAAGQGVRMVASFAYYPTWRKSGADAGKLYRTDDVAGVPVHRCWHYVPAKVTSLKRIVHELSFALTSTVRILVLPRADVYVVVSPPLLLGPCAWLVTCVKRSRYVFHVQDLQPDAALGLGMLKPGPFTRALYQLEAMAYRRAAAVSGISDGMLAAFERKGVPPERRWYFPNWINRLTSAAQPDEAERFRAQHGIEPGAMLAIYSGNIGRKQGLDVLIEAAVLIEKESPSAGRGTPVRILIVGDGAARVELEGVIAKSGLKHLRLLPLLSDADYRAALAAMEVAVITQTAGTGQYFFPSKLLSVLAAGKPVITVADSSSELAQAVAAGGFGRNVLPGDPAQLATVIAELAANPAQLTRLAEGTTWVRRFEREQVLGAYLERLRQIACTR